jgi:hypothetical protein
MNNSQEQRVLQRATAFVLACLLGTAVTATAQTT